MFVRTALYLALCALRPINALPFDVLSTAVLDAVADSGTFFVEAADALMPTCDLQNAVQYMNLSEASSPTTLPAPDSSLQLYHVAIGRGTQNYTCDLSNSTAVPVSIGAFATLFNASCIAAQSPETLAVLPQIALSFPKPTHENDESSLMFDVSGHQYFIDNYTVPYFSLNTEYHQWGAAGMNKTAVADAPSTAQPGANGAVQWLQLSPPTGQSTVFQQIYRLNTAGGAAPTTCEGQQAAFEVQYAAEYWFFVSS